MSFLEELYQKGYSKEETTLRYYSHITQGMRNDLLDKLNGVKEDTETKAS